MPYLTPRDYKKQIQTDNLAQVISNDFSNLLEMQLAAQAEAISYLKQKYDVSMEFSDTVVWDSGAQYTSGRRVYLDFPVYNGASSYVANNVCTYLNKCYICTSTPTPTTGAFDPTKWELLGDQYDMFYGKSPDPEFNVYNMYQTGDKVYWKGKRYTCMIASTYINAALNGQDILQYGKIENIPLPNVFPDDPVNGVTQWGIGTAYTIAAGTKVTNTAVWVKGDNRDAQMVMYNVDLVLFHIHSRIAPRNVPDTRQNRYDAAIAWLKGCAVGDFTPALPMLQPRQGARIRYGGSIPNNNRY